MKNGCCRSNSIYRRPCEGKPSGQSEIVRREAKSRGGRIAVALLMGTSVLTPVSTWTTPALAVCSANPGTPPPDYLISDPGIPPPIGPEIVNLDTDCPAVPGGAQTVEIPAGVIFDRFAQTDAIFGGGAGTTWTVVNNGGLRAGRRTLLLTGGGHSVVNAGEIAATAPTFINPMNSFAINLDGGGTVTNQATGTITGVIAILSDGAVVLDNAGAVVAIGTLGAAVMTGPGSLITNRAGGIIDGGATSTAISAGSGSQIDNLVGGSISGLDGIIGADVLTLDNAGNIAVTGRGVVAGANASIDNQSTGMISGDQAVVSGGTLDNSGAIAGVASGVDTNGSLVLNNHAGGTISGAAAVRAGHVLELDNAGTISGTDRGVEASSQAAVTNRAGATISGDTAIFTTRNMTIANSGDIIGTGIGATDAGVSIQLPMGGIPVVSITNDVGASISGNVGIRSIGSTTLVNAGRVVGTGGTAIESMGLVFTLELHASSEIVGNVLASVGNQDRFRLGGVDMGTFDVGAFGAQYRNFDIFEKSGSSTWSLTGADGVGADWVLMDGTLRLEDANALAVAGSMTIDGGTLDINDFDTETGSLSGAGGTVDLGSGRLTTGADGSSTSFAGTIMGSGGITKTGTGAFVLTGVNTYTGDTIVEAGTLRIGSAGAAPETSRLIVNDGIFDLSGFDVEMASLSGVGGTVALGSGRLTVGGDDSSTNYDGSIIGTGGLSKIGAGTLTLGGNSTFTGQTIIDGGTLINNGLLASPVFVRAGSVYGGTGTSGDLTVRSGGTVAPGDGIGTATVNGQLVFEDGSRYDLDLSPDGSSDRIAVSGTTVISPNGTVLSATGDPVLSYPRTQTFTVITSDGGVTGRFGTVVDNLPDIDLEAVYEADSVRLTYTQAPPDQPASTKTIHPSAQAAAMAASRDFAETLRRRGGLYAAADNGSNTAALSSGFMSGSALATGSAVHASSTGRPETIVPRDFAVWGAALGSSYDTDASNGNPGWESTNGGLAFGFERRFGQVVAGVATGYTHTDVTSASSSADINNWHVGAYGATTNGPLTVAGALAYTWQGYDFDRPVPFGGGTVVGHGEADGYALNASGEVFYDVSGYFGNVETSSLGTVRFGPLVTIDAVYGERDAFVETGAGILNLTLDQGTASQAITGLGVAFGTDRAAGAMRVTFDARLAWEHVFGDAFVSATSFIPDAGASFVSTSAPVDRDRLAVGLGAALAISDSVSAHLRYDGAFSESTQDHRGAAGLTIRF